MVYGKRRFGCNWVVEVVLRGGVRRGGGRVRRRHAGRRDSGRRGDPDERRRAPARAALGQREREPAARVLVHGRGERRASTSATTARARTCSGRSTAPTVSAQPDTPLPAGHVLLARGRAPPTTATWQLVIPSRESGLTTASATVPDYNGDGLADVAVGAPSARDGQRAGVLRQLLRRQPTADVTLTGGDQFGRAIAAVGDVNGDGFVDLAVASGGDPGTVNIYEGGAAGPSMGNAAAARPGDGRVRHDDGQRRRRQRRRLRRRDRRRAARSAQVFLGGAKGMAARPAFTLAGAAGGDALLVQGRATSTATARPTSSWAACSTSAPAAASRRRPTSRPDARRRLHGRQRRRRPDGFRGEPGDLPGDAGGIDGSQILVRSRRASSCSRRAGDIDGDGYGDTVSSISPMEGFPNASASTSARRPRAARTTAARSRRCSSPATISRPAA